MAFCFVLQLILAILFYARFTHAQFRNCAVGEPVNAPTDPYRNVPDVNITVSPGLVVEVGIRFKLTCIGGKPRYPSINVRPLPPSAGIALINSMPGRPCTPMGERIVCDHTVTFSEASNVNVTCWARNDNGCRVKKLLVRVLKKTAKSPSTAMLEKLVSTPVISSLVVISSSFYETRQLNKTASSQNPSTIITESPKSTQAISSSLIRASSLYEPPQMKKTSLSQNPSTIITENPKSTQAISSSLITTSSLYQPLQMEKTSLSHNSSTASSEKQVSKQVTPSSNVMSPSLYEQPSQNVKTSSFPRSIVTSTIGLPGNTGTNENQDEDDEDDLDDVKKMLTATLVIVIVTLLLVALAIVFVCRNIGGK